MPAAVVLDALAITPAGVVAISDEVPLPERLVEVTLRVGAVRRLEAAWPAEAPLSVSVHTVKR